jgi:hypothetical protein
MKTGAFILIVLWTVLLIEPLSANLNIKNHYAVSCSQKQKIRSCCAKSKCNKPKDNDKKNDCENKGCNPLMSCPTGNFYLFGQAYLAVAPFTLSKQKKSLINDNRIQKQLSECWHPPEII